MHEGSRGKASVSMTLTVWKVARGKQTMARSLYRRQLKVTPNLFGPEKGRGEKGVGVPPMPLFKSP